MKIIDKMKKMLNSLTWLLGGSVPRNADELKKLLLNTSQHSQAISRPQIDMLGNVLSLPDTRVEDVMVPHGKVDWLHVDDTYKEVLEKIATNNHSRYPVMDTDKEIVVGILHVKHLVEINANPEDKILTAEILQTSRTVPSSKKLDSMLREFQYYRSHIMVVADDAGRPAGMVFIEDVLEHIVGTIHDEFDQDIEVKSQIRATDKSNHWEVDGDTLIKKFNDHFETKIDDVRFDTVNGWISNHLGRLPEINEEIAENNLIIRVTKTDQRKVLTVEISKQDDEPAKANEAS